MHSAPPEEIPPESPNEDEEEGYLTQLMRERGLLAESGAEGSPGHESDSGAEGPAESGTQLTDEEKIRRSGFRVAGAGGPEAERDSRGFNYGGNYGSSTAGGTHLAPWTRLKARHFEIARLLFQGKTQAHIARRLGMTQASLSLLARDPKVLTEVERLRDLAFERTVSERLKNLGPESMDVIEGVITGEIEVKTEKRVETAQWVVEKLDGKATQKVDHASSTLDKFMDALRQMREAQPPPAEGGADNEVIDLTPAPEETPSEEQRALNPGATEAPPTQPDWADWFDRN